MLGFQMFDVTIIHLVFDIAALTCAVLAGVLVYYWRFQDVLPATTAKIGSGYFMFLSTGSIIGAYLFGTLNLYLSGTPEIGRSILGSLFGAVVTVETYKIIRGTKGSTGYIYVVPFCVCIIIGRLGCFFAGLPDQTYGVETALPWGVDFGDGIARHPVQLYESLSMLLCLIAIIITLKCCRQIIIRYGFYLCVGFYVLQRFCWEFLKPYGDLAFHLNIFQVLCFLLILYSLFMIMKARHDSRT